MIAKFPIELNPEENLSLNYAIGSLFLWLKYLIEKFCTQNFILKGELELYLDLMELMVQECQTQSPNDAQELKWA